MWCKNCVRENDNEKCELCGCVTEQDIPVEVYWCDDCRVPIIRTATDIDKNTCSLCRGKARYLCADLRPVFPEERLLLEILTAKPFEYRDKSVWATDNRYYIDGTPNVVTKNYYKKYSGEYVLEKLNEHKDSNDYAFFNDSMARFIKANQNRLNYLFDEAVSFIQQYAKDYTHEQIVVSFSGGKDSTVVADLVIRALNNASVVHIFGDTTLEFPLSVCPACH